MPNEEEFDPSLEALKISLKHLFTSRYFSICDIDNLLKMRHIIPDQKTYHIMHSVHCVDYKEMTPAFRKWLFQETINMFDVTTIEFDEELINEIKPETARFGLVKRITNSFSK